MGVFEVRIWSGAGVSVLVCTRGQRWRWIGGGLVCTISYTFLSEPACTACTNMVYSKELERDVTTTAKALLRQKTLA